MKKIVLSIGLGLSLATAAFAADNVIDQLNSQVESILAPYQNQATVAKFTFSDLEISAERALKVAVNAFYQKVGSQNTFELKIDNLSYSYGDGTNPTAALKSSVGVDITKLMNQDEINFIIPKASEIIENLANDFAHDFGDAVDVKSVVTSTTKDNDGNYTALSGLVSVKFDLSKLPDDMQIDEVFAKELGVSLSIDLKTGVKLDGFIIMNPDYIGFQEHQEGLKEDLEMLIDGDEEALANASSLADKLDDFASDIVEFKSIVQSFIQSKTAFLK